MKIKCKWLSVVLCLTIFLLMAVGSGTSSEEKKEVAPSNETESSAEKEESGDASVDDSSKTDDTTSAASTDVSIKEQVLVDQDGVIITAKEYTTDSIWGDGVKLLIENNSDNDYMIGCDALIVNDYMITDLFVSNIAAGKKANETMYLSSGGLKAAGIDSVGKIEMYFHAFDADYNIVFSEVYSEIQTSEYANMDTTPNDSGMELYNEGGIRIVGKTVDENSFWGTAILLYCENNSGKNVGIQVDDMSINGFMMSPLFSTTVYDGKKAIDDITIFTSDLEENGIESIDEVELKFHIYDSESYSTIKDTEPIKFSAK